MVFGLPVEKSVSVPHEINGSVAFWLADTMPKTTTDISLTFLSHLEGGSILARTKSAKIEENSIPMAMSGSGPKCNETEVLCGQAHDIN